MAVLESHIKPGGSAHSFSRVHNGGKYTFEVGPSIFEGLDKPSLNPLRIVFDTLGVEMPVKKYYGSTFSDQLPGPYGTAVLYCDRTRPVLYRRLPVLGTAVLYS